MNNQNERNYFINIFQKSLNPLKEIDNLAITKNNIGIAINNLNTKINKKKNISTLIIISLIIGACFAFEISCKITDKIYYNKPETTNETIIKSLMTYTSIITIVVAIIIVILYFLIKNLYSNFIIKPKINRLMWQINEIDSQINDIINNNIEVFKNIPPKYCYYFSVNYMLETMINQRSDSLKEAINIYEDQIHKWNMENYQQQICEINRQHQFALQNINVKLRAINQNTKNTAVASTLDFIFKN